MINIRNKFKPVLNKQWDVYKESHNLKNIMNVINKLKIENEQKILKCQA